MSNFTRTIEGFTCGNCGQKVTGNGYTNHCPVCLWSKHVDVNPGDRAETCGGMMKPIAVEIKSGEYILTHQCQKCGLKKKNKTTAEDNFESILKIIPKVP
jgi:ribosomal protein L37AE/L43A